MKKSINFILLIVASFLFSFKAIGQITATVTPTASTCQANGQIIITNAQGGAAPYEYALIAGPGVPTPANYQTGNQFTGLQAGDFTVSIVDANGDEKTFTTTVTSTYVIPNYTPVPTLNACASGQQDGKITFTNITGGTPPFQTRITQPTAQATAFVTGKLVYDNLPAGLSYEVQLIDACQNFQTRQVLMPQISYPVLSNATITKTACTLYSVDFTTSGGKMPYTYKVIAPSDGSIGTTSTTGHFDLPINKSYTVEVTDACGFKSTKAFSVNEITYLDAQTWGTGGTSCNGATGNVAIGGAVHIAVYGGLPPFTGTITSTNCTYTHTLNLNDVGGYYAEFSINDLPRPCHFQYTITDACGTTQTEEFDMIGPGGPSDTNLASGYEIKCPDMSVNPNESRYRLYAAAWYGPPYSPVGPFSMTVKDASGNHIAGSPFNQNSNEFWVPLTGGTYTFSITDQCGAKTETRTITIIDYVEPTLAVDLTNKCINAGQAKLIATNNTAGVTVDAKHEFKIIAGPDRVGEQNNDGIFSNLISGGVYTFEYYDGCSHVTIDVTVPPYTQPTFEVSYGAICPPATVSCLQAFNRQGGTNAVKYFYEIIPFNTTGTPSSVAEQLDSLFCNLTVGNYNVRGYDECNNSYTYLGKITPLTTPTIMAKNHYCVGETITLRATNPIYGAVYTWTQDGIEVYKGPKFIFTRPAATAAMSGAYKLKIEIPNAPTCTAESDPYAIKVGVDAEIAAIQPTCAGSIPNNDGKVQLTLGTVGNKYEFNTTGFNTLPTNISGATGTVSAVPQILKDNISSPNTAETYYIRVFDEFGCSKDISVVINPATCCVVPTLTIENPAGACLPATVNITALSVITANTGITTTYWKDAAATQALDANTGSATAIIQSGTYYVKSTSNDPNCFVVKPVVVTINALPTADAGLDKALNCTTKSTTIGTAAVAGNTYAWSPTTALSSAAVANPTATPNVTTTYILTVTNAAGCTATDAVIVTVDNTIPNAGPDQDLSCGTSTTVRSTSPLIANLPGGTWSSPTSTSILYFQSENDTTYAFITAKGVYPIVYTLNGCSDTLKVTFQDLAPSCNNLWDNLTLPLSVGVSTINTPVYGTVLNASAIGGETDVSNTLHAGGGGSGNSADISSGTISWNNGTGDFTKTIFSWDGIDNSAAVLNPTGLGGMNFSGAGNFGFIINSVDVARFKITLRLYTDASNISESYFTMDKAGVVNSNIPVEFTTFTTTAGTGANLSNIGAVELILEPKNLINESNGIDFNATCFHTPCLVCPTPVASSTATCVGGTLSLTASGGSSYSWTGPNGFTSTLQNPSRANATTAMSGNYTVTVTSNGCTAKQVVTNAIITNTSAATVSEVSCHNNGTLSASTDDYVTFLLTPSGNVGERFTLFATQGGNPISVTLSNGNATGNLSYAYPTPLRLPTGTAGKGNIILTLTDTKNPSCSTTVTVVDPGTCAVEACNATPQTVTYSYRIPFQSTELTQVPLSIPKFDDNGGSRTLTKTEIIYGISEATSGIIENTAASQSDITLTMNGSESIQLGSTVLKTGTFSFNATQTVAAGIIVPAQGSYAGDSVYTVFSTDRYSTVYRMNKWLSNYMDDIYFNPTTDSRWVTNATGNVTHDDDIYVIPVQSFNLIDTTVYTATADLSQFIGTGNLPLTASTDNNVLMQETGGNNIFSQRTKAYAYATVTYTYICYNCTQPVIGATTSSTPTCVGGNITLSTSGGSNYTWSGPNEFSSTLQNPIITNATLVNSGTYNVVVSNGVGCSATATIALTVNPLPTASITGTENLTCSTLSVSRTATGGGSYLWSNGLGTNATATITNAGTYTVTVTNTNGCTATVTTTVTIDNTVPTASITGTENLTCSTLSVSRTATGGGSYLWSNGLGTNATATITNAGTYTVIVTNTNGCTATATTTVTIDNTVPTASITGTGNLTCSTLSVNRTATGGGSYLWSNGLGTNATATITNAGTYTVTVTNTNGCTATATTTITIDNTVPTANITGTENLTCSTLSVSRTATGGGSYLWSNGLGTNATATITTAGTFTVTVTNTNGCTATATTTVTIDNTVPTASITGTENLTCSTLSVSRTATGGGSYLWSNGLGTNATATIINAGTYTVIVTNTNGCTATATTTVMIDNTVPTASITGTEDLTCTASSVTRVASGGGSYLWSNNLGTSATATISAAGTYTVTVTFANGCTATATTSVIVDTGVPAVAITATEDTLTCTKKQSVLTANIAPAGTYTYLWSNGSTASSINVNDAGTYSVEVTAVNGCKASASVVIVEFSTVTAQVDVKDIDCKGGNNGSITVTGFDGIAPYKYKLNTGTFQSNNVFSGLTAGTYAVAIQDAGGCTASINVTVREPLTNVALTVTPTNLKCNGATDGQIQAIATGGMPAYTFAINGGAAQSNSLFTNLIAGTYTITAADTKGCSTTATTEITQPTQLVITAIGSIIDCSTPKGTITATVTGGTPAYQYSIDGTNFQPSNSFTNLNGGTYTVTVKDLNLCVGTVNAAITVADTVKPTFALAVATMATCTAGDANNDGKLTVTGVINGVSYQYSVGSTFNASAATPAVATAIPSNGVLTNNLPNPMVNSQFYTIRIFNSNGCYKDVTVELLKRVCACKPEICIPVLIRKLKSK